MKSSQNFSQSCYISTSGINTSLLFIIAIFFCFSSRIDAQTLLVGPDYLPNAFTYCGKDTFSVDIRTPSGASSQGATFSNIDFEITLPAGMTYFAGTAWAEDLENNIAHGINGETVSSNGEIVTLNLANFLPNPTTGDTVRVFLTVRASCDMPQDVIDYEINYDYNNPAVPSSGSRTGSYSSDQIGLASPNILIIDGQSDYNENNVFNGDSWTRSYHITNSVIDDYCVDTMYFFDTYATDISVLSYNTGTLISTAGGTNVLMLTSTDFMALMGKPRFCKDDTLTIFEVVQSNECITNTGQQVSDVKIGFGCESDASTGNLCQLSERSPIHTYEDGDPGVYWRDMISLGGPNVFPELSWVPSCKSEGKMWTMGTLIINPDDKFQATDILYRIFGYSGTTIDTSSIMWKINTSGTYQHYTGSYNYIGKYSGTLATLADDCAPEFNRIRDVRFTFPELQPGDTLFIIQDITACYAEEGTCINYYYDSPGYYSNLYYKDACANASYYKSYAIRLPTHHLNSPPATSYDPTIPEGTKGDISYELVAHVRRNNEFYSKECDQNGVYPYGDPVKPAYEVILDYDNQFLEFENAAGDFSMEAVTGELWTPSSVDFTTTPGKIIAIFDMPPPVGFGGVAAPVDCASYNVDLNGVTLNYKLKGICPFPCAGYITTQVSFEMNHITDKCADPNDWNRTTMRCGDAPINITTVCEFCNPCDGTSVVSHSMVRKNYGFQDADNDRFEDFPDGGVLANPLTTPEIATDRFFIGDTAIGNYTLKVNTSQFSNFSFQYFRIGLPSADYQAITTDFTIYDVSTGDTYSFENVPGQYQSVGAGNELVYNLSPYLLQSYGPDNIPADFVFEQNDSIVGNYMFKVFENVGDARLQKVLNVTGFNTTDLNAGPGDRYSCNIFFEPLTLVGYRHYHYNYFINTNGCNDGQQAYYQGFYVGPNSGSNNQARDQFPYEYRELTKYDNYRFKIPDTYTFQYMRGYIRGDEGGGVDSRLITENSIIDPSYYYVDPATNELVVLVQNFVDELNGTGIGGGPIDETMRLIFRPYFQATCETELNKVNTLEENKAFIHQFASECDGPDPDTIPYTYTNRYVRETIEPIINATIQSPAALLYTPEAIWQIEVEGGANGPRTSFLYFDSDPIVTIAEVKRVSDGTIITPVNGIYQLGNTRNVTETYEIKSYVKACEPGSVKAHVGWQCDTDEYPVSIAEYETTSCTPFDLDLLYEPLPNSIQTDFINTVEQDTVELCETIDYSVLVRSISTATNYNLRAYLVIPGANSPYTLVDGEATLTYPYTGGAPVTLDTTSLTIGQSSSFPPYNGDAYFWDLNGTLDSLPGLGDSPFVPEEDRSMRFDWKLNTTCEVVSGTELWFFFVYEDACGNEKYTPTKFSKTIHIDGAVVDTLLDWVIEMDDPPLNPCLDEHEYQVDVTNLSGFESKGQDQLVLTLNENVQFISASCDVTSDECPVNVNNPTITITNPGNGQAGFQEIVWDLPPGISENEQVKIDFVVDADEALECGETAFVFGTEAEGPKIECADGSATPDSCAISISTTNGKPIFYVDVVKPILSMNVLNTTSSVIPGIGEALEYEIEICNSGEPVDPADTIALNIFYDVDQNDTIEIGTDLMIHEQKRGGALANGDCFIFKDTIDLTAGLTCGLFMSFGTETCMCEGFEPVDLGNFPTVGTINSEDFTLCSEETQMIQGDSLPGYTYTWIGDTEGIVNPNELNTEVSLANTTSSAIVKTYVLEIDRAGGSDCDALDTIEVTILPEVDATGTVVNISCNSLTNGSIDITPSGGLAPYTFAWSTGATTEDITGLAVGTYTVTITSDSLCSNIFEYMVSEPTTLALGIGSSAAFCGQADGTASVLASGGSAPYTYAWSNGGNTATLTSIVPGFYQVTVTDAGGCQGSAEVTVGADGGPDIAVSSTNTDCASGNNGTANIAVSPAGGSYAYSWSNGATTSSVTGLTPGIYNITVTDLNTNCFSLGTAEIGFGEEMFLAPSTLDPSCGGGTDGAVSVNITGGTAPFQYLWDDPSASTSVGLTGVGQGVYCVTVTDADMCTANTCFNLSEDCCALDVTATPDTVSCFGQSDGEIILVVNAGTAPFTYQWSHSAAETDSIASVLSPGDYTVTISDAICTIVETFTVTDAEILDINLTKQNVSTCATGGCNGSVDLEVNGGTSPYNYFWTTGLSGTLPTSGVSQTVLTGLCLGIYDVTVTDANGCEATSKVFMGIDPSFTVTTGVTNSDCGENNGRIEINTIGGVSPFTYVWDSYPDTDNVLENIPSGIYTVTATDAIGCDVIQQVFVNSDTATGPQIISMVPTDTECGVANGSVNATIGNGATPYTYLWSNGATTEDIANLPAGTYSLMVTDAAGCIAMQEVTVEELGFEVDFTYNEPPCNSLAGFIIANGVGGTAPYSYEWDNGEMDNTIQNIRSGLYYVTVTDATGCTSVARAELNTTNGPQINNITLGDISCHGMNDGTIDLDISGGTAPYNILWNNFMTGPSIGNLSADTFTVVITDLNGCKAYGEYILTEPDEIVNFQLSTEDHIDCGGDDSGAIFLQHISGTAPYTYAWSDGATTKDRPNVVADTYRVTVTDAGGCEAFGETIITQEDTLVINNLTFKDTICPSEILDFDIEITGGVSPFTFVWSTGATTEDLIGISAAGTYTVTVTDNLGCTMEEAYTLIQSTLALNSTKIDAVCGLDNGQITAVTSGGIAPYSYAWSHDGTLTGDNVTDLPIGNYTVTVTDNIGCTTEETIEILPVTAYIPLTVEDDEICEGDDLVMYTPLVADSYNWVGPNGFSSNLQYPAAITNATPLNSGTYTLSVEIAGCFFPDTVFQVTVNPQPVSPVVTNDGPKCEGETIVLFTTSTATSYHWIAPSASISDPTTWTTTTAATHNVTDTDPGNWTLIIEDANGCQSEPATTMIIFNPIPDAPIVQNDGSICEGEDVNLQAPTITGATYTWYQTGVTSSISNLQNPTVSGLTAAGSPVEFCLEITIDGCVSSRSCTDVIINSTPTINAMVNGGTCGDALELESKPDDGTPPYSYSWSGPNSFTSTDQNPEILNPTVANEGSYEVTVIDANGCEATATVQVSGTSPTITQPIIEGEFPVCEGDPVELTTLVYSGTSVSYEWEGPLATSTSNGDYLDAPNLTIQNADAIHAGTYRVIVTVDGCQSTSNEILVEVNSPPVAMPTIAPGATCATAGTDVTLTASPSGGVPPYEFSWVGPDGYASNVENPVLTNVDGSYSGNYTLIVYDENGCESAVELVTLDIKNAPSDPIFNNPGLVCHGEALELNVQVYSGSVVTYSWFFNSTAISNNSNTLIIDPATSANSGTYEVVVDVDGCESDTASIDIVIGEEILVTANDITLNCTDGTESVDLEMSIVGGNAPYTYSWTGPNSFTSTDSVPVLPNVTSLNSGTYQIQVTDDLGCTSEIESLVLTITDQPESPNLQPVGVICEGDPLTLSIQNYSGATVTYNWLFEGNPIPNNSNTLVIDPATSLASGTYEVFVLENGCSSDTAEIEINVNDAIAVTVPNQTINCVDGTTDLTLSSTVTGGTAPYTYAWTGPNGFTSSLATPVIPNITSNDAGTYSLTITDFLDCTSDLASGIIEISDKPDNPIISPVATICDGETLEISIQTYSGTNVVYDWMYNSTSLGNNSSTLIIDPATNANSGLYEVAVTVDGCTSDTGSITITINDPIVASVTDQTLSCINTGTDLTLLNAVSGGTAPYTYVWTGPNGFTSTTATPVLPNVSSLESGVYTLVVTDNIGCASPAASGTITITDQPEDPIISPVATICDGETLEISIQTYSGTNVVYDWMYNSTSLGNNSSTLIIDPATNANSGLYEVAVTVDGCTSDTSSITITINDPIVASVTDQTLSCINTGTDLTLLNAVSGGTAPYTYVWTGPNGFTSTTATPVLTNVSSLESGVYTLVVTDNIGCASPAASGTITITDQPEDPIISPVATICDGETLEISIQTYSGTNVVYDWMYNSTSLGNNSSTLIIDPATNANSGLYEVAVTVDGCTSDTSSITITINDPIVASVNDQTLSCINTGTDLTLLNAVSGGTAPYTYVWTGPNGFTSTTATPVLTNVSSLESGVYTLVVTDNVGCASEAASGTITITDQPEDPIISPVATICDGETLEISIQTYSGTNVVYDWMYNSTSLGNNSSTLIIDPATNANSGLYEVAVTVDGCTSDTSSITITINDPIVASVNDQTLSCINTGTDLTLLNAVSGGTAPYTYVWTGPNGFTSTTATPVLPNVSSLESGVYTLVITDNVGCASPAASGTITITDQPEYPIISPVATICDGETLEISIQTYSGTNVVYDWMYNSTSLGNNSSTLIIDPATNANSGLYEVAVTVDGCTSDTSSITITINDPIVASVNDQTLSCINTGTDLTLLNAVSGGTAPYTYVWTGPNGFTSTTATPVLPNVSSLESGVYTLVVTDNIGCASPAASGTITITDQPEYPIISPVATICDGETLEISIQTYSGTNVVYDWMYNSTSLGNNSSTLIIDPATNANSGLYEVAVTVDGCTSDTSSITITINDPIVASVNDQTLSCINTGTDLTLLNAVSGGTAPYTYVWTGPNGFTSTTATPVLTNVSSLESGVYTLVVTDNVGCASEAASGTITITDQPEDPIISPVATICDGETLEISIQTYSGTNVVYDWMYNSTSLGNNSSTLIIDPATNANSGLYEVAVTVDGCTSDTSSITITINDPIVASVNDQILSCINTGTDLTLLNTVSGGTAPYTYVWTGPNGFTSTTATPVLPNVSSLESGVYTLVVTDNVGCASPTASGTITITDQPEDPIISPVATICDGETLEISIQTYGGTNVVYDWMYNSTSLGNNSSTLIIDPATNANSGLYEVAVTVDGCTSDTSSITITINDPIVASVNDQTLSCINMGTDLTLLNTVSGGTAPYTYVWTGPNGFTSTTATPVLTNVSSLESGVYTLVVTDNIGCASPTASGTITITDQPEDPIISPVATICDGETLEISIQTYSGTNVVYDWMYNSTSLGNNSSTLIIDPATNANNGLYEVAVTVDGCTSDTSSITITINDPIVASVTDQTLSCINTGTDLTLLNTVSGGTAPYTYVWTGPNGFTSTTATPVLPNVSSLESGVYTLVVTDNVGCASEAASGTITITDQPEDPIISPVATICDGETLEISIQTYSGTNVVYDWMYNSTSLGNNSSTLIIDPATNANSGLYEVAVTVDGCTSDTSSITITINDPIVASVTDQTLSCINTGTDLTLLNAVSGGTAPYTYVWTGPNGFTSTTATPVLTNVSSLESGVYTLVVTDNVGCASPTASGTITITDQPEDPIISPVATICDGETLEISIQTYSGTNVVYDWMYNSTSLGNNSSTLIIDPATNANSGLYEVAVTVDGCTSDTSSITITINDPIVASVNDQTLSCINTGTDLTLLNTVSGGTAPYTYVWTGPNGFTSTTATPVLTNVSSLESGVYTLVITDNVGCVSEAASGTITITDQPEDPIISPVATICDGETLEISIQTYSGTNVVYDWMYNSTSLGNNSSTLIIDPATNANSGLYEVAVTVDGCTSDTSSITITINDPIVASVNDQTLSCINTGTDLTLLNTVSGGTAPYTYVWTGPNGFTSTTATPVLTNVK